MDPVEEACGCVWDDTPEDGPMWLTICATCAKPSELSDDMSWSLKTSVVDWEPEES